MWIGRPLLLTVIVTSAAWQATGFFDAEWQPGTVETPVTSPTLTPAIRTNEPGWSPFALENTAWIVYLPANGLANFVYAPYENATIRRIPIAPAANLLSPFPRRPLRFIVSCSPGRSGAGVRSAGCG